MRDAIKAVLGVLGYTNEDFSGSLQESRLAKFKSLSLDSGIYRDLDEVLTREDCINLFYNLMNTKENKKVNHVTMTAPNAPAKNR
jgi:hypothetical protein